MDKTLKLEGSVYGPSSCVFALDARFLALDCHKESAKDELEPEELDDVEEDLHQRGYYGTNPNRSWVRKDVEFLLYLVVPEQQHGHEDNACDDIAEEEASVDGHEERALTLTMLDHPPPIVHEEACELTHKLATGQSDIESSTDENSNCTEPANDVMYYKVAAFLHGVA